MHPFHPAERLEEVADGFALYKGFVNVVAVRSGDGRAARRHRLVRAVPAPEELRGRAAAGRPSASTRRSTRTATSTTRTGCRRSSPRRRARAGRRRASSATRAVPIRIARYGETAGYNQIVNQRQFGIPMRWPTDPILPDRRLRRSAHARRRRRARRAPPRARRDRRPHLGVVPARARALHGRSLHLGAPNAGNPQKVQRYAADWAVALRRMAALGAAVAAARARPADRGRGARARRARGHRGATSSRSIARPLALLNAGRRPSTRSSRP